MSRILAMITALAVIGLTGCGGDDQSDTGAATDASAATAEESEPTAANSSGDLEAWCLLFDAPADFEEEDDLETVYRSIQARQEALAAVAPAEISDANEVAVEQGRTLDEHLESYDWDPDAPRLDAEFERDLREAETAMKAYADSNC